MTSVGDYFWSRKWNFDIREGLPGLDFECSDLIQAGGADRSRSNYFSMMIPSLVLSKSDIQHTFLCTKRVPQGQNWFNSWRKLESVNFLIYVK